MDLDWEAEIHERGGKAACLEVVFCEHAEEVDGGEVEELDWSVDEDAYAKGWKFVVCVGSHGCCVVAERRRMDWRFEWGGDGAI